MIREADRTESLCMRVIGADDLAPRMYVTVLRERRELMPWYPFDQETLGDPEPIRWEQTRRDAGLPMRVVGVCVPFVLVELPCGEHETLDVRRQQLARLADRFGAEAFKRMRADAERPRSRRRRRDDDDDDDDDKKDDSR